MGMSTHVVGFRPPDERWQQMKSIWDACKVARIEIPDEVDLFFQGEEPDPNGVEVDIPSHKWRGNASEGIEVRVDELPPDLKVIRFYNAW